MSMTELERRCVDAGEAVAGLCLDTDAGKLAIVRAVLAEAGVAELVEALHEAADVRWNELAQGSPLTVIDRQMLKNMHDNAGRALAKARA